jgi:hypothetical protein
MSRLRSWPTPPVVRQAALALAIEMFASEHWTERKAAICLLRRWRQLSPDHRKTAQSDPHPAVRAAAT